MSTSKKGVFISITKLPIDIFGNNTLNDIEYVDIQFEDGSVALSVPKSAFDTIQGPYSEIY